MLRRPRCNLAVHNRWLLAPPCPADKPYTLIVPIGDVRRPRAWWPTSACKAARSC
jgi:hypothetical protein